MNMKWSTSSHRPPHLFIDNAWYFITASVVDKRHIFSSDAHFTIWVKAFKELISEFDAKLAAWVILANHYHFLFLPRHGIELGKFMKRLNGRTSKELNELDHEAGQNGLVQLLGYLHSRRKGFLDTLQLHPFQSRQAWLRRKSRRLEIFEYSSIYRRGQ